MIVGGKICSGVRSGLLCIAGDRRCVTRVGAHGYGVPAINITTKPCLAIRRLSIEVAGCTKHHRLCLLASERLRLFVLEVDHHDQHSMLAQGISTDREFSRCDVQAFARIQLQCFSNLHAADTDTHDAAKCLRRVLCKPDFEFSSSGVKEVKQTTTAVRILVNNFEFTFKPDRSTSLRRSDHSSCNDYDTQQNERRTPNDG